MGDVVAGFAVDFQQIASIISLIHQFRQEILGTLAISDVVVLIVFLCESLIMMAEAWIAEFIDC